MQFWHWMDGRLWLKTIYCTDRHAHPGVCREGGFRPGGCIRDFCRFYVVGMLASLPEIGYNEKRSSPEVYDA